MSPTAASIVIPAHNEAKVLPRLLDALLAEAAPGEFEIVVVANGCTDDTVAVARRYGDAVQVLDSPVPSKRHALRLGDEAVTAFPRIYLDADVEIGTAGIRALRAELEKPGVHAAAPERSLALAGSAWPVRWYYAVWTRLPEVRAGLFGRGVIAVSAEGNARLNALPQVMADDLAASNAFAPAERMVVRNVAVVVHPPRTFGDLMRRRVRAVTSVAELEGTRTGARAPGTATDGERAEGGQAGDGWTADGQNASGQGAGGQGGGRTSVGDLLGVVRSAPWLAPHLVLFLAVTLAARARARRAVRSGDFTTWLRDESSRG
ncbi:glycosyltransferase [Streptosporangium carneum]|uniref:glycosyltransferase n=1 Tax=Streptosporangium carneum TaxID=47481 RepID=UPI0022F2EC76|nr:glycosyltransferase [Streptosporangium carneum]